MVGSCHFQTMLGIAQGVAVTLFPEVNVGPYATRKITKDICCCSVMTLHVACRCITAAVWTHVSADYRHAAKHLITVTCLASTSARKSHSAMCGMLVAQCLLEAYKRQIDEF